MVAAGADADPLLPPPQATRVAAAMAVVAKKAIRENGACMSIASYITYGLASESASLNWAAMTLY
jgi:hypothetical protein